MPNPKLSDSLAQQSLDWVELYGSGHLTHLALADDLPEGMPAPRTIDYRANTATSRGMRPTKRKEAARVYSRERLGTMLVVIPDTQVKAGVCTDHLEWVGNYIAEKRPDGIIHIGDHWDMPSLSSYDKGKLSFEGRRYVSDVKAGKDGMERLCAPFRGIEGYKPTMDFFTGNHEQRIVRFADEFPEMAGKVDIGDLCIADWGWKVHPFLKVVRLHGIDFAHYFISGAMGRPVSSAAALLRTRQSSAIMGHVQNTDVAIHSRTGYTSIFCGTCYLHDEEYLGHQANNQRRQILVLHEVKDGIFDIMFVSLNYLKKAYS